MPDNSVSLCPFVRFGRVVIVRLAFIKTHVFYHVTDHVIGNCMKFYRLRYTFDPLYPDAGVLFLVMIS